MKWEAVPDNYGSWFVAKGNRAIAQELTMQQAIALSTGLNKYDANERKDDDETGRIHALAQQANPDC